MALSGVKTWSATRNDIIQAALRKLSAYDSSTGAAPYEYTDAQFALNAICKELVAEGVGLWLRQTTALVLSSGQRVYAMGPSGDHAFAQSLLKKNTVSADEVAGQTIISTTDTSWVDYAGIATAKPTANHVGIRLDSGAMHWTTIAGVGADTITLAAALPSDASVGARIYAHASYTARPIRVVSAYREDVNGIASLVSLIGRENYERLSDKGSSGDPTQVHFDPQMTDARLWVWPTDNSTTTDLLVMVTEHYPDDFTAATDNPQFPAEWVNALVWMLAADVAPEYGVPYLERREFERIALQKKMIVLNTMDRENASVTFGVEA